MMAHVRYLMFFCFVFDLLSQVLSKTLGNFALACVMKPFFESQINQPQESQQSIHMRSGAGLVVYQNTTLLIVSSPVIKMFLIMNTIHFLWLLIKNPKKAITHYIDG